MMLYSIMTRGCRNRLSSQGQPYISIWEIVSTAACIGIGCVCFFYPQGLGQSAFFPILKEWTSPQAVAIMVALIGLGRLCVLIFATKSERARSFCALIAMMVWGQWAAGFVNTISSHGVRPGMLHLAAMVYGEFLLIYWLATGCFTQLSRTEGGPASQRSP